MKKKFSLVVLTFLAGMLVSCVEANESAGEFIDNSAITAKVKARLVDELGTNGFSIKVNTFKDTVQLSGFVQNNNLKQRAANIAHQVTGVERVRNDLIVR